MEQPNEVQALNVEIDKGMFDRLEHASNITNFTKKAILVEALDNWLRGKFPAYEKAFQSVHEIQGKKP